MVTGSSGSHSTAIDDLPGLVARVADSDADRTALATGDSTISYGDLHRELVNLDDAMGGVLGAEALVPLVFTNLAHGAVESAEGGLETLVAAIVADAREFLGEAVHVAVGPAADTLSARFKTQVNRTPDAVALVFGDTSLTYAEFDAAVNRLARRLISLGVGPEIRVGLSIPRSIELLVAMYAVVEAGGAYVPIDPDHPADRIEYVLTTAGPLLVLTTSGADTALPEGVRILEVDTEDVSGYSAAPIAAEERRGRTTSSTIAYVIFTSGSTGRPKGVAVSHEAIVANLDWRQTDYPLSAHDVVLQKTPFTFDVSVWEFFWPLQAGASLVVAEPDGHRDPEYIAEVMAKYSVTTAHFVPSMLAVFLDRFVTTGTSSSMPRLRQVFASGEALPASTARSFHTLFDAELHNLYGPTEAAVDVTYHRTDDSDVVSVPIGVAVPRTGLQILDKGLHPVPPGVPGELYLSGVQLARGYLGRPDLTADRFIADITGTSGERMYRTGDLVRRNDKGALEYLGRTDFQVKLRGLRIELPEIEAALLGDSSVRQAAVVVLSDDSDSGVDDRLVAYVVTSTGEADSAALAAGIRDRLPDYMVPAVFVALKEFPLNASGKLDRKALPKPDKPVHAAQYRAPETDTEQALVSVFEDILGTDKLGDDRLGIDDDFFALGGNSLSATRAIARVSADRGVRVDVREFFDAPTVAGLAALVEKARSAGVLAREPLTRRERPAVVPLSLAQQRMWFLNRLDSESAVDNIPLAIRLSGLLDIDALQAAVGDVVERHESLRTVYPEVDGVGHQEVRDASGSTPELRPEPVAEDELYRRVVEIVSAGFDVTSEVPLRLRLLELSGTEHVLVVVVHHIAADGFSMVPLTRDVVTAYAARSDGRAPGWAPLEVQYADFALWQRAVLGSEDDPSSLISEQEQFWRTALADLPEQLDLPADRRRPAVASGRGATYSAVLDAEVRRGVEALATDAGATPFMVVHGALSVLLARLSGTADVAVGTAVAGRGERMLDDLVGMFVNTLVLRATVTGSERFVDVLAAVRSSDLDAFGRVDLPFERVVEVIDPPRSQARHPLVQILLVFQNLGTTSLELPGLTVSGVEFDTALAKMDIQITVSERADESGGGWALDFTYATDLFDEQTVATFADRLILILGAAAADPAVVVGDIDLLGAVGRDRVLHEWNATAHDVEEDSLLTAFHQTVERTPDSVALSFEGEDLTFREFSGRISRLARHLVTLGVGPDVLVAVAIRRSIDMVVALYAVLEAGGGYVPIDPDQPAVRNRYILDTSAALIVLTTARDNVDLAHEKVVAVDTVDLSSYFDAPLTDSDRSASVHPDRLAYVIFTSGSTGRPKGVAVSNRAVVNQVSWVVAEYGLGELDVVLQKTPFTFDVSVWELFGAPACGARLVIARPDGHRDAAYVADLVYEQGVTATSFVPSMVPIFSAEMSTKGRSALRLVQLAGEALPTSTVEALSRATNAQIYNLYGPTEFTVHATSRPVAGVPDWELLDTTAPMGRPVWNTAAYVLDSRLTPVPIGVAGELYLSGVQMARGYQGRAALTAERFVADPFGSGRLYRTGDLVRWNQSGELEYLGRTDFQVKLRGLRIELGEMETVARSVDSVADAVAAVRNDRLVLYVVAQSSPVDTEALRTAMAKELPAYMVPAVFVALDSLPLSSAGKLDRNALPEPEFEVRSLRAPSTPVEEIVAGVFAEVLGVERVGADDDFFGMGGNSLIATQVVSRIGSALDTVVPVRLLFEVSTVAALAVRIESQAGQGARVPLEKRERPDRIPLSMAQQRMWFLNRLEPDSAVNNIPVAIRLSGLLDRHALHVAVADVLSRHESLRTVYPEIDGTGYQKVVSTRSVIPDLAPIEVNDEQLAASIEETVLAGFDVTTRAPFRASLFEVSSTEHVLVFVAHHIAADGFSLGPLTRDIVRAYTARAAGLDLTWDPLSVQYADYTLWQREILGSEQDSESTISRQRAFWQSELDGIPGQLSLPFDRRRPKVSTYVGRTYRLDVSPQRRGAVEKLAAERRATPFMVVHAAVAVLLARLSGTDDIVIGAPIAGRGDAALDDMIGMFVNTLVLRTNVNAPARFDELLQQVRTRDLAAFAHADLPFERLVEILDPARSTAHHPLFQVALVFQNLGHSELELPNLTVSAVDFDPGTAKFDLQIAVSDTADGRGWSIEFNYATDLFDASSVEILALRFERVLDAVTANPSAVVGEIDVLDGAERRLLRDERNATDYAVADVILLDEFCLQVERTPDVPALVFEGQTVTYRDFSTRMNRLARHLVDRGVGPDTAVAVGMRRSVELLVGIYAVVKAGGAYVPLDPDQPTERIDYILETSNAALVLSTERDELVVGTSIDIVLVDDSVLDEISGDPLNETEMLGTVRPDNAAYVLFTSGSTGRPKGVTISHRAIVNRLEWMQHEYGLHGDDVVVQKTPVTFDVSVWELFWPLRVGARMIIASPDGHRDPAYLSRLFAAESVSVAHFVPSMLAVFTAEPSVASATTLRWVFASGEALPSITAAQLAQVLPSTRIVNLYGPTEAAVDVTYHEYADADAAGVPIGRPVWNTEVYVLDNALGLAPDGAEGELYLGGVQLARGYSSRADLTADRFVANPFGAGRLYRTGDIVRWNAAGELVYVGRSDFQVKLRGQRIELGEIQAALLAHETVDQAVVAVRSDQLVAWVVLSPGSAAFDLTSAAAERLPEFMVPSAFVVREALPLTISGKLDRKALPAPEFETAEFRAPSTPIEEIVAGIFVEVLGVPRVGLDDDFFTLGGNSLVATQLVSRLGAALDSRVAVRTLFEASTVESLAAAVETNTGGRVELSTMPRPDRIPLSLAQQRMWFLNRLDPDSAVNNIPAAVRLTGTLDIEALTEAIDDVVARHEILRTVYPESAGTGTQVILPAAPRRADFAVEEINEPELVDRVVSIVTAGFDVTRVAPVRIRLLQISETEHVLVVVAYHIAADGFSMIPLMRDVISAYVARAQGEAPAWAPLAVQYADYTLWQRQVLGSSTDSTSLVSGQETYWKNTLAGLPEELELPVDRSRPSAATGRGASHRFVLDEVTTAAIESVATDLRSTPFMVVHAALAVLLARVSGSADVAVGTPVAGRGEAVLDDVIGMFVNTLVLRTAVDGSASFADVVAVVREVDLAAFAHADVPFERIVEVVDPPRSQGRHPLVQVLLTFQNFASTSFDLPGLTASSVDFDAAVAKMDLQVTVTEPHEQPDGTQGRSVEFVYATDLFDEETVAVLGRRFAAVLSVVTSDPAVAVGDVEMATAEETSWLLQDVNDTDRPIDSSATLMSMFDAQVAATPDGVALKFEGASLTYREFDARANRLARYLISQGVGPESCVAIGMSRSIDMLVGIYAVLKAGGAYVPVDPGQPAERVAYILSTSGAELLLSNSIDATPFDGVRVIEIDAGIADAESDTPVTDRDRLARLTSGSSAYVLFTSGSTGKPKGVVIDHRAIVNRLVWMQDQYELNSTDVVIQKTPVTFDVSVWELFWPLHIGASLVIAKPEGHRDPAYLADLMARERVSVVHFVPSMLAAYAAEPSAHRSDAVRWVFASGEALPAPTARALTQVLPTARVVNLYGPTEAAVDVTHHEFSDLDTAGVPIGLPIYNTQVYVLDGRLRPVPIGAVGELYLGGIQLARGYASRADLSADRFVADPFSGEGGRLYRTGDLVRFSPRRELDYIGRSDFQVKLRGLRIELGEIENALLQDEAVTRAVVLVRADRLVAYVVPAPNTAIDADRLRVSLSVALPEYMVPAAFVVLDAVPVGASGKLDRNALPDPVFETVEFRKPVTETEQVVAGVFAEVLGVETVGLDDDFFSLGGNSLLATQVVARVGAALDASVPVRMLFDGSTVGRFAELVSDLAGTGARAPLVAGPRPERIPLSLAQQRMWVINHLDPESGAYNIPLAVRLTGELDIDALQAAVMDVLARHESLRTIYPLDTDGPMQRILPASDVSLDLRPTRVDGEAEAVQAVSTLVLDGFDVSDAVPIRVGLIELEPTQYVLALVVHHISADGASIAPLARDVMTAYAARTQGQQPQWEPLPVQYADFALWQRLVLGSADQPDSVVAQQLDYWTQNLAGAPEALDLPTDRPRPPTQSMNGRSIDFGLDGSSHAALAEFAKNRGTTLFMVVHAGLAVLLGRLSGSSDIVVGTPVAGRGAAELDELVGMFVNTLPLRTQVDFGETFSGLVDEVRATDLGAFAHGDIPFESIVDAVVQSRAASRHPIFQVVLSFQNLERVRLDLPGLTVEGLDAGELGAKFDLQVTVEASTHEDGSAAGIFGSLLYATDLFDQSTAASFGERLTRILRAVAENPYVVVGDIDIMSESERAKTEVVTSGAPTAGTSEPVARDRSLPQAISSVVEQDPDAPALAFDGEELSYLQFEGRSAKLARVLIEHGVGPGEKVIISMSPSTEWAVAVWATILAGAAVVVVDGKSDLRLGVDAGGAKIHLTDSSTPTPDRLSRIEIDDASIVTAIADASPRPIAYSARTRLLGLSDPAVVRVGVEGAVAEVSQAELVGRLAEANDRLGLDYESRVIADPESGEAWQLWSLLSAAVSGAVWVVPSPEEGSDFGSLALDEWATHAFVAGTEYAAWDTEEFEDLEVVVLTDGGVSGGSEAVESASDEPHVHAAELPLGRPS